MSLQRFQIRVKGRNYAADMKSYKPIIRTYDLDLEGDEYLQSIEFHVYNGSEWLPLLIFPFSMTADRMFIRYERDES